MSDNSKQVKKKNAFINLFLILIFLAGLLIMVYPQISRLYYRIEAKEQILEFDEGRKSLNDGEVQRRMDLAYAYNELLSNVVDEDPYSDEMKAQGRAEYAHMLEIHEKMGYIQIPRIDVDIPIYAGTTEEVLQIGAGHLEGTSLPVGGNSTHTVITAHSGLPKARLFSDLQKLEIGDKFYIHNLKEILAYQVDHIEVIDPADFSKLLIVPGHDYATLLTCTPVMINTHRLLVRGHRVPYVAAVDEKDIAENKSNHVYKYLFYLSLVLIFLLLLAVIYLRRKKRRAEKLCSAYREQQNSREESDERKEEKE